MLLHEEQCNITSTELEALSDADISELCAELHSDWQVEDNKLVRELELVDFKEVVSLINAIAVEAEEQGHHPDLMVHYNILTLELWTHAVEGLTRNDFIMAAKIDQLS